VHKKRGIEKRPPSKRESSMGLGSAEFKALIGAF